MKPLNRKPRLTYYCDKNRHLVCTPYSRENLDKMADRLGIGRHWFYKHHYDIPARRIGEIMNKCTIVSSKDIVRIIRNEYE